MKYPIGCYILQYVKDARGIVAVDENDEPKTERVPSYLLGRHLYTNKEGDIQFLYETCDHTGVVTWVTEDALVYEITDIHERFRRVKQ